MRSLRSRLEQLEDTLEAEPEYRWWQYASGDKTFRLYDGIMVMAKVGLDEFVRLAEELAVAKTCLHETGEASHNIVFQHGKDYYPIPMGDLPEGVLRVHGQALTTVFEMEATLLRSIGGSNGEYITYPGGGCDMRTVWPAVRFDGVYWHEEGVTPVFYNDQTDTHLCCGDIQPDVDVWFVHPDPQSERGFPNHWYHSRYIATGHDVRRALSIETGGVNGES